MALSPHSLPEAMLVLMVLAVTQTQADLSLPQRHPGPLPASSSLTHTLPQAVGSEGALCGRAGTSRGTCKLMGTRCRLMPAPHNPACAPDHVCCVHEPEYGNEREKRDLTRKEGHGSEDNLRKMNKDGGENNGKRNAARKDINAKRRWKNSGIGENGGLKISNGSNRKLQEKQLNRRNTNNRRGKTNGSNEEGRLKGSNRDKRKLNDGNKEAEGEQSERSNKNNRRRKNRGDEKEEQLNRGKRSWAKPTKRRRKMNNMKGTLNKSNGDYDGKNKGNKEEGKTKEGRQRRENKEGKTKKGGEGGKKAGNGTKEGNNTTNVKTKKNTASAKAVCVSSGCSQVKGKCVQTRKCTAANSGFYNGRCKGGSACRGKVCCVSCKKDCKKYKGTIETSKCTSLGKSKVKKLKNCNCCVTTCKDKKNRCQALGGTCSNTRTCKLAGGVETSINVCRSKTTCVCCLPAGSVVTTTTTPGSTTTTTTTPGSTTTTTTTPGSTTSTTPGSTTSTTPGSTTTMTTTPGSTTTTTPGSTTSTTPGSTTSTTPGSITSTTPGSITSTTPGSTTSTTPGSNTT